MLMTFAELGAQISERYGAKSTSVFKWELTNIFPGNLLASN